MTFSIRIVTAAALIAAAPASWAGKSQAKAGEDGEMPQVSIPVSSAPEFAVRSLYSPYMPGGDESKSAFDNESERAKRFAAGLVKEMKAYFAKQEKAGEPGGLDFDPIVNGQDYKVGQLNVRADNVVPGKSAVVLAEFKNFDENVRLKFKMVFEGGAWKVDNIASLRDPVWDLRDLLKGD
jgi:hypothetical protein